jgi:hypothetical protein
MKKYRRSKKIKGGAAAYISARAASRASTTETTPSRAATTETTTTRGAPCNDDGILKFSNGDSINKQEEYGISQLINIKLLNKSISDFMNYSKTNVVKLFYGALILGTKGRYSRANTGFGIGVINSNYKELIEGLIRTEKYDDVYNYLFEEFGGKCVDGTIVHISPRPRIMESLFTRIFTSDRTERSNGVNDSKYGISENLKSNEFLSFDNLKLKINKSLNIASLIVWWNWVTTMGTGSFCTTLNNILRNNYEGDTNDFLLWRTILYNMMGTNWLGLVDMKNKIAQSEMSLDTQSRYLELTSDDVDVDENGDCIYLYRGEKFENGKHWLINQIEGMEIFHNLLSKSGENSEFNISNIGEYLIISQLSTISSTYNKGTAVRFANRAKADKSVLITIKGTVGYSGNKIMNISGTPFEIELYGPTRQDEIVLPPCMFVITGCKLEAGRYYLDLYVINDINSLILDNMLTGIYFKGTPDYERLEGILPYIYDFLKLYDRNNVEQFNKSIQTIFEIFNLQKNMANQIIHPELFEILGKLQALNKGRKARESSGAGEDVEMIYREFINKMGELNDAYRAEVEAEARAQVAEAQVAEARAAEAHAAAEAQVAEAQAAETRAAAGAQAAAEAGAVADEIAELQTLIADLMALPY